MTLALAPNLAFANDTEDAHDSETVSGVQDSSGFAVTPGFGPSSLDLDYEDESERAAAFMFRIDRYDGEKNYGLQYSVLNAVLPFQTIVEDLFDCFFSSDDDCDDDDENTTSLSELAFLYGWRKPEVTYSLGLAYIETDNSVNKDDDYSKIGLVANLRTELFWIVDGFVHVNLNQEDSFGVLYIGYRFD